MESAESFTELLARAVQTTAELKDILPKSDAAVSVSKQTKVPFKARVVRGTMLWRLHDLADAACDALRAGRVIPGMILARAALETSALLFVLGKKIRTSIDSHDIGPVDEYLRRLLGGSKYFEEGGEPYNVQTAISHVGKEDGFVEDLYAWLSEHTHPNRLGAADAYSTYDQQSRLATYQFNAEEVQPHEGCVGVMASIGLAFRSVDSIDVAMAAFVSLCETDLAS